MLIQPGVCDLGFIDLSGGQECLGILPVDHIPVHIHIIEGVVLTDALRLIVELLGRIKIVNPDVIDGLCVIIDVVSGQRIVCRKGFHTDVIQLICILGIFDIPVQIFAFLVDFIRGYHKILNHIARA